VAFVSLRSTARPRPFVAGLVLALGLALAACARAPESEICPRLEAGDLVISELRGAQSSTDSVGHYIEIYNASGRALELEGVWLRQVALDGSEQAYFIREPLELAAGGYAVIGPGSHSVDELPTWLDYGVGWDISGGNVSEGVYPRELIRSNYPSGSFEIESCGVLIDRVFYAPGSLPTSGTLACGGAETPPSATANDDASAGCWCVDDAAADPNFPMPGVGLPGTPGRANRCP